MAAGPVTLNQQQFQQLRPQGDYQKYLSFVANRRGVPASTLSPGGSNFNPDTSFAAPAQGGGSTLAKAATSDPANALAGLLGYTPLTSAQIQQQAQSEISPIISAITGQANTQAAQQAQQIQGLTQDYANELGQINVAAPYQQAIPQQAAADSALQQSLTGGGSSAAAGLANRLAALQGSSGAGAVQQAGQALTSQGAGSGTTALANGSAALGSLIANAAAGGEFGQKMPLIADLSGMQALGENAGAQQQAISNGVLQAETQLPSIVQDLTANQQTALANAASVQQAQQSLADTNYWKGVSATQAGQRIAVSQGQLNLDAKKAAQTAVNSDRNYALSLARVGISQKSLQLKAAEQDYKLSNGGFTSSQVAKFNGELQSGLQTVPAGASYGDFVKQAVSKGIPLSLAINAANAHWPATQRPAPGDIASIVGATQGDVNATGFPQSQSDYQKMTGTTAPQQYALAQLPKYGWNTPSESAALNELWQNESGWNPGAVNKSSGAKGIPQELGHTVPANYDTDPRVQVTWGLNYIKSTYGSPSRALAFWQATVNKNAAIAPADLQAKAQQWISKGYQGY